MSNAKLYRGDGPLLGVCAGLGEYFGVDPVLIRILFVVAVLGFGTGVLIYIVLALVMSPR